MLGKIFLIGPRASGKTSLGKLLAASLDVNFLDTDQVFTETYGTDIATLVEKEGWPAFRRYESELLETLSREPGPLVLATGGGIVLAEENRAVMRARGTVFYLAAPAEELAKRLAADPRAGQRPTLTGQGLVEEVAEVLRQREEMYRRTAHCTINVSEHITIALNAMISIINGPGESVWKK